MLDGSGTTVPGLAIAANSRPRLSRYRPNSASVSVGGSSPLRWALSSSSQSFYVAPATRGLSSAIRANSSRSLSITWRTSRTRVLPTAARTQLAGMAAISR